MSEEAEMQARVSKLEAEVDALKKLVGKLEKKLAETEEQTPKRPGVIGDLSDGVSRGLKRRPDDELPRRQGPQIG